MPRTFKKCEIVDAANAARENDLRVIMRANGDMEFVPANHRRHRVDLEDEAPEDAALREFQERRAINGGKLARHS